MSAAGQEVRSRRALLAGSIGGLAALALDAFGRPRITEAANGDTVKVGQGRTGSATTSITSSSITAFLGVSSTGGARAVRGLASATSGDGMGVHGESKSGAGAGVNGFNAATSGVPVGVRGVSTGPGIGVYGFAGRGVLGEASTAGGSGVVAKNTASTGSGRALTALAFSPSAEAIYAENSGDNGSGHAIHATSSTLTTVLVDNVSADPTAVGLAVTAPDIGVETSGRIGVLGEVRTTTNAVGTRSGVRGVADDPNHFGGSFANLNTQGFGLQVTAGLKLVGAAGKATIASGSNQVTVSPPAPIRNTTLVLATLQSNPGAGRTVARVEVSGSAVTTFTIFLTGNTTQQCEVGWIILN